MGLQLEEVPGGPTAQNAASVCSLGTPGEQHSPPGGPGCWGGCRDPEVERGRRHSGLGRKRPLGDPLAGFQSEEDTVGEILNESWVPSEVTPANNSSASLWRTQWTAREFKFSGSYCRQRTVVSAFFSLAPPAGSQQTQGCSYFFPSCICLAWFTV